MKTVVNTAQVAHLWANQSQEHARNGKGSFFFGGPAIYSYRKSWPLAVFTPWEDDRGRRIVIVNTKHYGNTTGRHSSYVAQSLRGLPVRTYESDNTMREHALAEGSPHALDVPVSVYAARVSESLDRASRRRCPFSFRCDITTARESHAKGSELIALAAKLDRGAGRALAKLLPPLPGYVPSAEDMQDGGDVATWESLTMPVVMKAYRAERKQANAAGEFKAHADALVTLWKLARDHFAARAWASAGKASETAENNRRKLERIAKAHGIKIPSRLPTLRAIERFDNAIAPRLAESAANEAAADAQQYERVVRHLIAERRRARKNNGVSPFGNDPNELAVVMMEGGYCRALQVHVPPLSRAENSAAVVRGERPHGNAGKISTAMAYTGKDKAANAAKARMVAAYARMWAYVGPLCNSIGRMYARARLESLVYNVRRQIGIAEGSPNPDRDWSIASGAVKHYADFRDKHARLTDGGLPTPETFAQQIEQATRAARIARAVDALRSFDASPHWFIEPLRSAVERGHVFDAVARLARAREELTKIRQSLSLVVSDPRAFSDPYQFARVQRRADEASKEVDAIGEHVNAMQADMVQAWRKHDPGAPRPAGFVFRLAANGREIESSGGARVSVSAGRRLWAMIRACVARGEPRTWPHGEGPHVGYFTVRAINADGSAVVGCHDITADEARAFAEHMQWPPFGTETTEDDSADVRDEVNA